MSEICKFLIHASYLEIYNEEIRDLLGKDVKAKLELKEHPEKGVYVAGGSSKLFFKTITATTIIIEFATKGCLKSKVMLKIKI